MSPGKAPSAAQQTTTGSERSPFADTTPAVMTEASLGTTGSTASSSANVTRMRYAHPDASATRWVNWSNKWSAGCGGAVAHAVHEQTRDATGLVVRLRHVAGHADARERAKQVAGVDVVADATGLDRGCDETVECGCHAFVARREQVG